MNKLLVSKFEHLFIDHPMYDMNAAKFSLEIEKLVKEQKIDYLEAVCQLCEQFEIEAEAVPKLLTATMKDKIEIAANERHFRIGR